MRGICQPDPALIAGILLLTVNQLDAKRRFHPPPVVFFLAAVVIEILLHRYLPLVTLIPQPWRWLGWLPLAAGLSLAALAIGAFVKHKTTIHPGRESSALVTGGVFRLSRNPMYLAIVLTLAGEALYLGTLAPWLLPLALFALMSFCYIPAEEALLARTFGAAYQEYCRRVRRWL